ncbi:MAG: ATP-dependent helicase C-terminal domain-containing protein [Pirellulales bacterium]|nr:ATP-dependent helicase C-terminal domain-containing protein [Pirellulales bacterium]
MSATPTTLFPLPIDDILPDVLADLRRVPNLALAAPPGAGKSTRVPPAILHHVLNATDKLLLLQPRRLAARGLADRIATEQQWRLGEEVGYHVRFERRAQRSTRLIVQTDGMFLRYLADNPWLEGVGAVLLDEFHERSLNIDLALALCRRVQAEYRPDLRIVVMSATLDVAPVAAFLPNCAIRQSAGRTFPVEIHHQRLVDSRQWQTAICATVRDTAVRTPGHVLVFLPGVGEILACQRELRSWAEAENRLLLPLYGDLPLERQATVLAPADRQKIILSTNVAETSLTIDGVTAVIDRGLARVLRQNPASGINQLQLERISAASATQRAGRAGRTGPGVCIRLWSESEQRGLAEFDTPEIERVELSGAVLQVLAWGENDAQAFPWFSPPPAAKIEQALQLLRALGALEMGQRLTPLGWQMSRLPLQPRLARLLLAGKEWGMNQPAALLAALLAERDPFAMNSGRPGETTGQSNIRPLRQPARSGHVSRSDVLDRYEELRAWAQRQSGGDFWQGQINPQAAKAIIRASEQLQRQLDDLAEIDTPTGAPVTDEEEALLRLILTAFPDRVARRRGPRDSRALLVGGRGVKLLSSSAVQDAELFVCVDMQETGGSEALVRQASAIEESWLDNSLLSESTILSFDATRERVIALRERRYLDLPLAAAPTSIPEELRPAASELLAAQARLDPRQVLAATENLTTFELRLATLRRAMPELNLPAIDDSFWQILLPELCMGLSSFAELRQLPLLDRLRQHLGYDKCVLLDREAPEKLTVPSGSRITLEYSAEQPPILAVRIQELFGLRETPRIAGGRLPVLLHLLGPNFRPQQVTGDLASFWKNTYPEVKKELKRRYPKHSWPDDPLTATPERKGGGRGW